MISREFVLTAISTTSAKPLNGDFDAILRSNKALIFYDT